MKLIISRISHYFRNIQVCSGYPFSLHNSVDLQGLLFTSSFLNDTLARWRIFLLPVFFSFSPLNKIFHCLLTSMVSDKKSTVWKCFFSVYVIFLWLLSRFALVFRKFTMSFLNFSFVIFKMCLSLNLEHFPSLFLHVFFSASFSLYLLLHRSKQILLQDGSYTGWQLDRIWVLSMRCELWVWWYFKEILLLRSDVVMCWDFQGCSYGVNVFCTWNYPEFEGSERVDCNEVNSAQNKTYPDPNLWDLHRVHYSTKSDYYLVWQIHD